MKKTYKRILFKLSGEALSGKGKLGIDFKEARSVAKELVDVRKSGTELAVVVGGGAVVDEVDDVVVAAIAAGGCAYAAAWRCCAVGVVCVCWRGCGVAVCVMRLQA